MASAWLSNETYLHFTSLPELSKRFQKPQGVYKMVVDGKKEIFTDISKSKKEDLAPTPEDGEELLF